ncbi:hypothetical protein FEM03_01475 [Phragmitibacter flavus]|uniref:Uncharacterized protein n=1 Tax=Phragmitibacter flavus TaxID=2576071 RepID=A0A5R8KKE5_9BACT|nr:hypothetical protein [Phragmitibacter flavus]TLD72772.1 hypothetical protein FEM03_01475 [Phragmitibacter flavus]
MKSAPLLLPSPAIVTLLTLTLTLSIFAPLAQAQFERERSRLGSNTEPGAMYVEDILPKAVRLTVSAESPIYYQVDMQRVLGAMAPGTVVQLVAMSDTGYRVRGRARHGDVAGWMRMDHVKSADPKLPEKLKAFYERKKEVDALIAENQVAIGMTVEEVKASLGNPSRKSSKITANGREESLEYSIFERVPQITTGRDRLGNLVQTTIYVKVEVGRLSVAFKDNVVTEIAETMGNPLGEDGVKLLPTPIILY